MSGGLRVSLAVPGATAAELLVLAPIADHWNVAALWIGDPRGQAPNSADSYVTATAGALSAVTDDVRLGLFLSLAEERQVVRLAEDVAVTDQASGGRVELAFVPVAGAGAEWTARVAALLNAWNAWQLPGRDETVAVIPGPAQPQLPRVVVDDDRAAASLGAGRMVFGGDGAIADALVAPRTILVVEVDLTQRDFTGWLSEPGAYARVSELRERAGAAGAHELLLSTRGLPGEQDLEAIGTVLVPSLRAADRDARAIATDAWAWLTQKADLHLPPPSSSS